MKERQLAEHQVAVAAGSRTVDDALAMYRQRLEGDASIKPRTREYQQQRITALSKLWPELKRTEVRGATKTDCLNWAARFGRSSSATALNHTIGILRRILEVGVESGVRCDNPARFIRRRSEKSKKPKLPEQSAETGRWPGASPKSRTAGWRYGYGPGAPPRQSVHGLGVDLPPQYAAAGSSILGPRPGP